MPFVVKLNPEFSSYSLEEAKTIIALSLFLLVSKKKAIIVSFPLASISAGFQPPPPLVK